MTRRTAGVLAAALGAVALGAAVLGTPVATTEGPEPSVAGPPSAAPSSLPTPPEHPDPPDPPPPAEPLPRTVTVAVSGDVLPHTGVWLSAEQAAARTGRGRYDFEPMFAGLRPVLAAADLAVCHLEVPLAEPGGPFLNYPLFSGPPQILAGLQAAGVDACTTASNHSVDQGFEGLARTLDALDARGVEHAGTARSRTEARTPTLLSVPGDRGEATVALLSYTYGTNGLPVDADKPWSVNLLEVDRMLAEARRARTAGAEVVLVAVHDGAEYVTEPTGQQRAVFARLARSPDIDLVYGHHAHVVQPVERIGRTWVLYGLGNLIAQQETGRPDTYRGLAATLTFEEQDDGSFVARPPVLTPTFITPYGGAPMRVLDVRRALRDPATDRALLPALRTALAEVRADALTREARRDGAAVAPLAAG